MVSIHSKKAFSVYEKFGGLQALKRASSSTGIHATLAKTTRVQVPNELRERIPIPINPFPIKDDPYKPPFEITCETKQQLND